MPIAEATGAFDPFSEEVQQARQRRYAVGFLECEVLVESLCRHVQLAALAAEGLKARFDASGGLSADDLNATVNILDEICDEALSLRDTHRKASLDDQQQS